MKKRIIITTLITLLISVLAFGQESDKETKKKVDNTKKEVAEVDKKIDKAQKGTVKSYQEFKKETDKKLREIEKNLAVLSTKVESMDDKDRTAYVIRIKNLKDKSKSLRAKLTEYKQDKGGINTSGSFQEEFQKDMQTLDEALDNFFEDNKK